MSYQAPFPTPGYGPGQTWMQPWTMASVLPTTPSRYHHFWRAPGTAWWRTGIAAVIGIALFLVAQVAVIVVGPAIDYLRNGTPFADSLALLTQGSISPGTFLANNLALAALIPTAWLASAVVGQRPGWMSSVLGRFRWCWWLRSVGVLLPLWVVFSIVQQWVAPAELHRGPDTVFVLVAVLVTTPLQCAGEEFAFRGILLRAVASWFRRPVVALVAGGLVSALAFTLAHGADDPWLWLFYFTFGASAVYLTWRTGGLEASIAMHLVNNMTAMALMPWQNISTLFDRGAGSAGPGILINIAVLVGGVALVEWQARRTGITALNAPGRTPLPPTPPQAPGPPEPLSWSGPGPVPLPR